MIQPVDIKDVQYKIYMEKGKFFVRVELHPNIKGKRNKIRKMPLQEWLNYMTISKEGWDKLAVLYLSPVERALRKLKL